MARILVLLVMPNPFAALDSDGEPAAVFPRVDLPNLLVGARVDHERSKDGAAKFFFDLSKPVQLPDLPTYRNALRSGDLLPANEATARLVGRPFVPPEEALREAEMRAAARWRAETGEDPPFVVKKREGAATGEPRTGIEMKATPNGSVGELTEPSPSATPVSTPSDEATPSAPSPSASPSSPAVEASPGASSPSTPASASSAS